MNANELNANNWPEFIPKEIIASGVYVITQNHAITMNMTMAKDVTLIFDGGMLTGNGIQSREIIPQLLHLKFKY